MHKKRVTVVAGAAKGPAMNSLNCPLHGEQDGRDRLYEGRWPRQHPDHRLKSRRQAQNCPAHISSNSWRQAALKPCNRSIVPSMAISRSSTKLLSGSK
jgi:hypothetical protein